AEITSNVIAVPKSTTTHGPPNWWNAATPFTMRSAPTSIGLSTCTDMPVFTPISTKRAFLPRYSRDISASVQFSGGTTELMITPLIISLFKPANENRLRVSTPYSSTVCVRAVVSLQLEISSSSRNTPSTVLVLPTSIVSSIVQRTSVTSPAITVTSGPLSLATSRRPSGLSPAVVPA